MLNAVTNRDFPMLQAVLEQLMGMKLEYDPALFRADRLPKGPAPDAESGGSRNRLKSLASTARARVRPFSSFGQLFKYARQEDPAGRIRIVFLDGVDDLSFGMAHDSCVIGFNVARHKVVFVGVPEVLETISEDCDHVPKTLDGYLLSVTLHELYENLTGDVRHCRNPGKCVNSICRLYENGTCGVCMGGLIEEKYPDL